MNRKLFFWLEKLKITPHERITITILLVLLLLLTLLNSVIEIGASAGPKDYKALKEEINERKALMARQEAELMKRYHPQSAPESERPSMLAVAAAGGDTLPVSPYTSEVGSETEVQPVQDSGKININAATRDQLESLPGIGPVYAERIVKYRQTVGKFKSVDDLVKIKGIGEKRLEKIKPLVEI